MRYRDLIRISKNAAATNDPDPDYTGTLRYRSVPCKVLPVSGAESIRGRQLLAETTHVVMLRYLPNILPSDRISIIGGLFNGRTLGIVAIREADSDGEQQSLELQCKELLVA